MRNMAPVCEEVALSHCLDGFFCEAKHFSSSTPYKISNLVALGGLGTAKDRERRRGWGGGQREREKERERGGGGSERERGRERDRGGRTWGLEKGCGNDVAVVWFYKKRSSNLKKKKTGRVPVVSGRLKTQKDGFYM